MHHRHSPYTLVALALAACLPQEALDSYSEGAATATAATGGASPTGGGAGAPSADTECGNGTIEEGEECDTAGLSPACDADCTIIRCPEGCECVSSETTVFAACSEALTFEEAREGCYALGWELAIPGSAHESSVIGVAQARLGASLMWIDATDAAKEGVWLTNNGEVLWRGEANGQLNGEFEAWRSGQPTNVSGDEDCAQIDLQRSWNTQPCSESLPYVCAQRPRPSESCGNGEVDPGEACDLGGAASTACDTDCTLPYCGDGLVNETSGEACDDGNADDFDTCNTQCQRTWLLAHWPLDESVGTIAYDVASFMYEGDLVNGEFSADGPGFHFNGLNQAIVINATRALQVEGEVTMMARIHATGAPLVGRERGALLSNSNGGTLENWLRLEADTLQGGAWSEAAEVDAQVSLPEIWSEDTEQHVAVRYDGTAWTLFHDGALVITVENDQGAHAIEGPWSIGGRPDLNERYFEGFIRDVRLYDVALSDEQIRDIAALEP